MTGPREGAPGRAFRALVQHEARLTLRRGENAVVTIVLPAAVLLFLSIVPLGPAGSGGLAGITARVLATAVVATGLVSLGISAAFERTDGWLRRIALTPAPAWTVVAAKSTVVAATVAVQAALLVGVAVAVGWRPDPLSLLAAVPSVALGTVAHAAAGLALAFRLRAESVLAVANALFVVLLLAGGLIVPASLLPPPLSVIASALPSGLLAATVQAAFAGEALEPVALGGLTAWAVALAVLAAASVRTAP